MASSIAIQDFLNNILYIVFDARFLWLPIILAVIFWNLWVYYVRSQFISKIDWILLEIKLPKEIFKSPRAMEVVLNALHITSDGNFFDKYITGKLRPWFSLEIVGIDGGVHFFVYAQRFYRNLIESQIYSQYPGIEISEVNDYTKVCATEGFSQAWGSFGTEFGLTAEDAYPIRTYVDYGLDKETVKEEYKTDPITSFIELLGSLKEGEQIWLQILVRATKKSWAKEGEASINKIMGITPESTSEDKSKAKGMLGSGKIEAIKAIERNVSKLGFDIGMRMMYLAKKEKFNGINIPSMIGTMKQYSTTNLNGFKPVNVIGVDYSWQFKKIRESKMRNTMFDAYNNRSYFYMPHERKPFVLSSEELATIYHFPGGVSETPTFGRIEAKKSEAPSNLPI